jgi:UDP-glucuronate 4-epimerase
VSLHVLVTGAAGFIGGHLCRVLLDDGCAVTGVEAFAPYYDRSIKERHIAAVVGHPRFALIEADVRAPDAWHDAATRADVVVHLAARPGVRASFRAPVATMEINAGGTAAVLETCRRAGVSRLVIGSSSSVYGEVRGAAREEGSTVRPLSPYGVSKRAAELLADAYAVGCGFRTALLRLFSVYGPGQRPDQAFHRFADAMAQGRAVEQFGDGGSARDYTYVTDAVRGIVAAIHWTGGAEPRAEAFNIGSGRPVPLRDALGLLGTALRVEPRVRQTAARRGDPYRTHADLAKAGTVLGYAPSVTLEDGIENFVRWYEAIYGRESRTTA